MAKLDPKLWGDLKCAWDHLKTVPSFDKIDGIKVRVVDGNYAVVMWRLGDGQCAVIDFERRGAGADARWRAFVDAAHVMTERQWHLLHIPQQPDERFTVIPSSAILL